MEQGEIYLADTDVGRRPVIVVSREELNRGRYVVAVLCTSTRFAVRSTLPHCVPFQAGDFGFSRDCVAQCESIQYIQHADLLVPLGKLDDVAMRDVVKAIGNVIEADCEPE